MQDRGTFLQSLYTRAKEAGPVGCQVGLLLAHRADSEGHVTLTYDMAAEEIGESSRTVRRAVKQLEEMGLLTHARTGRGCSFILSACSADRTPQATHRVDTTVQSEWTPVSNQEQSGHHRPIRVDTSVQSAEQAGNSEGDTPSLFPHTPLSLPPAGRDSIKDSYPPLTPPRGGVAAGSRKKPRDRPPPPTAETWEAYKGAYTLAYKVEPVRNAKVNAQIAQLVQRLGEEDAPKVAAWYVSHRGTWYVKHCHPVSALLHDCEGLRTQWQKGITVHQKDANEIDRTSATVEMWKRIAARQEARERGEHPP